MSVPLSEQMRPKKLKDFVGQNHLFGGRGLLDHILESKRPRSLLLWGPPGSGKTTLAKLYSQNFDTRFVALSAVFSGVGDLKKLINEIESAPLLYRETIVFVDEIHRFNKAQQDVFLPYLEKGTFVLVGATTENPSFALNDALLSRLHVLTLKTLSLEDLESILQRYEKEHSALKLEKEVRDLLLDLAQGDARSLLNMVEQLGERCLDKEGLLDLFQRRAPLYDRDGEGHYNLISALHKSVRGSDPDAALYWFYRMVEGGEPLLFLARRLIRMASEDVGLADPQALLQAMAARDAYEMLGSPEGDLVLAQVVVYLALAPKSNALYMASKSAQDSAKKTGNLPPPKHICNPVTKLMKQEGYGRGYCYDHDFEHAFSGQSYFPEVMSSEQFYIPVERGFERELQKRIAFFSRLRKRLTKI